jgi:hypothetical protein
VAGDRRDFVFGAARFRELAGRRLAQSVRATVRQACIIALLTEPISEARSGKWLPELGGQKEAVAALERIRTAWARYAALPATE